MIDFKKPFLANPRGEDTPVSYGSLLADLQREPAYCPLLHSKNVSLQLRNLTAALLSNQEITLLDGNLTASEVASIADPARVNRSAPANFSFSSVEEFRTLIRRSEARITLFTSGTTGQPKRVTHSFQRFVASAKLDDRFNGDVWAFAYSPTHMAGLQVFAQALANLNTIVDVFARPKDETLKLMRVHGATHLSATPTFYRLLLPVDFSIPSVKRITVGGERSDAALHERMARMFPSARLANIYASTEAGALFRSDGSDFEVKPEVADLVKVVEGELWLNRRLLGDGPTTENEWYPTSDLVEITGENPLRIRFMARKNEMVNVGGYKVNPSEVEEALNSHPGVANSLVYSRPNSVLGNLLLAQVQKIDGGPLSEKEIRDYLADKLQPFKIPRMISFVDRLDLTTTGKAKRK